MKARSWPTNCCKGSRKSRSMTRSTKQNGTVYLVGAGPGDLGLVTLRAKECIESADAIVYDHLANPEMISWARDDAEIIYAGKEPGESRTQQEMLMGVERLGSITSEMLKQGVRSDLPVALVRSATTGQQETLIGTLEDIAKKAVASDFKAPAVAVFGEVVGLRDSLNWYEKRPLLGKRIVVTRTRKQASVLSDKLRTLGAHVIELPTIRIEPPSDLREFAELVQDVHIYDWIVFTSANGVEAFFDMFFKLYDDAREMGAVRIAAIGPATAQRVKDFHLHVDLQPDEFVAEAVVKEFKRQGSIENLRILLVRADKARDALPKELSALGAIVDEAFAYRTVPETRDTSGARRQLAQDGADLITFTSSSTVENFLALGLPWPQGMRIASIGPITSKTVRDHGLNVDVEARRHDIEGLVQAVRELFAEKG